MRKTIKKINSSNVPDYTESTELDEEPAEEDQHISKVANLLQKMSSSVHVENVGEGLTNFQPLSYPEL